jgi:hypothetical protein
MKELTWKQHVQAAGLTVAQWRNAVYSGKAAYAFGEKVPTKGGKYFACDSAFLDLSYALSPALGLRETSAFLRLENDVALAAIAAADWGDAEVFLVIAEADDNGQKIINLSAGVLASFVGFRPKGLPPTRMTFVSVNEALSRVRERAKGIGVDLSAPFLPPPDSEHFKTLLEAGRDIADRAGAKVLKATAATEARH